MLFDLCGVTETTRFSPFVWRTRLSLAHKGLDHEVTLCGFTDKDKFAPSGSKTVPVIKHGDEWVADSWNIACYLEDNFPGPSLFDPAGRAVAQFYADWVNSALLPPLFMSIVAEIPQHLKDEDLRYFVTMRERRIGMSLEDTVPLRPQNLAAFNKALHPARSVLAGADFLGGDAPFYGDFCLFAAFQWARMVTDIPILETDDPLNAWIARFDGLYDGLTRV